MRGNWERIVNGSDFIIVLDCVFWVVFMVNCYKVFKIVNIIDIFYLGLMW